MAEHGSELYYREVLLKKEGSKNWVEYYATLIGNKLIFDKRETNPHLLNTSSNMIEITNKTICHFGDKKTCYRFPFSIQIGKIRYDFKCETKLQRHKWLYAIRLCALGKPPEKIPNFIPTKTPGSRTKSRSNSASTRGKRSIHGLPNGNVDQKSYTSEYVASCIDLQTTTTRKVEGSLAQLQKKKDEHSCVTENGHAERPPIVRSKSDLESSTLKNKDSIKKRPIYRSGSSDLEIESLKQSKKTVKWDLRSVISYVSKTLHPEHTSYTVSSSSKSRKSSEHKHKNSTEQKLESSVVENHYVDWSEQSENGLQSCINKTKKRRNSEDRGSTVSTEDSIFKTPNESLNQSNGFVTIDQSEAFINMKGKSIEKNDIPKIITSKFDDLEVTPVEDFENISDDEKANNRPSNYNIAYDSIDPRRRNNNFDYSLNNEENTYHKKYDDKSLLQSDGSRRPSLVKYRSDGHIETFFDKDISKNDNPNSILLSDRFGNRKMSTDSKSAIQDYTKLRQCGERAQSWAALNVLYSPKSKPTRRESSAPPLRFSRHKIN